VRGREGEEGQVPQPDFLEIDDDDDNNNDAILFIGV